MSYRYMRILVFFDLPVVTPKNRCDYRRFRNYLIKNGFIMLQESVYCRMALNQTAVNIITDGLKKNKPSEGIIQILQITEKQFQRMEYLLGEYHSDVIDTDERLVIL